MQLIIEKDYVVYVEDFVSYDFQSFFGEVGGTLGLLLGVSLSHIFEFVGNSLKHGFTKWAQRTKKIATNILNWDVLKNALEKVWIHSLMSISLYR